MLQNRPNHRSAEESPSDASANAYAREREEEELEEFERRNRAQSERIQRQSLAEARTLLEQERKKRGASLLLSPLLGDKAEQGELDYRMVEDRVESGGMGLSASHRIQDQEQVPQSELIDPGPIEARAIGGEAHFEQGADGGYKTYSPTPPQLEQEHFTVRRDEPVMLDGMEIVRALREEFHAARLTPRYFEDIEPFSLVRLPRRNAEAVEAGSASMLKLVRAVSAEMRGIVEEARRSLGTIASAEFEGLKHDIEGTALKVRNDFAAERATGAPSRSEASPPESVHTLSNERFFVPFPAQANTGLERDMSRTGSLLGTIDSALIRISFAEDRLSAQSGTDNENLAVTPHLAKLRLYKSELEQVSGEVRESESLVARRSAEALPQAA